MKTTSTVFAVFGLASMGAAHMQMTEPPALGSTLNKNTAEGDKDYSMTSPLSASGSDFPCKGHHKLTGASAASVATWTPGSSQKMTISGGAAHEGGSCQASLSFDKGNTWKVIHSYIGNCPVQGDSSYDFTVPTDTPSGEALFAWSWFNKVGNREMYMNCASITIGGGSKKAKRVEESKRAGFSSLPDMFVANVGNGCSTKESADLMFPNPGTEVTNKSQNTAPPVGSCAGGNGGNNGGGNNGGDNTQPASSAPAATSHAQTQPATSAVQAPTSTPVAVVPTTIQTATKSATQPATPTQTTPASGGEGAFPQGQACTTEGEWNCIGGSKYQRCASGQWSALTDVSPGTTCTPGQSANLMVTRSEPERKSFIQVIRSLF